MRRTVVVGGVAMATVLVLAAPAAAQEVSAASVQANLDILYLMLASVLVFFMHPGFALLESGLTRSKNAAHIIMKNLSTLTLGIVTYYAVGFGVMYGAQFGGLFGTDGFFLMGLSAYEPVTGGSLSMDFLFQAMFAATAATIISGACAERMRFGAYAVVVVVMTGLIYPVVGAWKWGGGWLAGLGFLDFAGSTVVHLTGGVAALVGAAILGPRIGKYGSGKQAALIPGHSIPLAMLGVFILFFGWFGFNGGSLLVASDGGAVADVLVATALAGAAGGVAAASFTRVRSGTFDVAMTGNGILAGLVGVTAGADVLSNLGALGVGIVAGVLVAVAVPLIDRLGVDDPVGAVAVHGVCGALGTLWVGLAHTSDGLLYGGGASLLGVQALGVLSVGAFVAAAAGLLFSGLKATMGIRVTAVEEIEGLDLHEHGLYGYPELALGAAAFPQGRTPRRSRRTAPTCRCRRCRSQGSPCRSDRPTTAFGGPGRRRPGPAACPRTPPCCRPLRCWRPHPARRATWTGSRSTCCAPSRSATSASCGCGSPTCWAFSSRWPSPRPSWRAPSPRASASTARRSTGSPACRSPTCSPCRTRRRSRCCRGGGGRERPHVLRHPHAARRAVRGRPAAGAAAQPRARRRHGLQLLRPPGDGVLPVPGTGRPTPLDMGGYFDLTPFDVQQDFRREAIETLEAMGISVEYSPPRGRPQPARDRPALRRRADDGRQRHDLPARRQGARDAARHPRRSCRSRWPRTGAAGCTRICRCSTATATPSTTPPTPTTCPTPPSTSWPGCSSTPVRWRRCAASG